MLTDAELNQMLADAAEMQRLRDSVARRPWVFDVMGDFIAAARSDKSAEHVERLVQEVRTLNVMLRQLAPKPAQYSEFFSPTYFQLSAGIHGYHQVAKRIINACHIHGVEVPPHLKPYEENANVE